MLSFLFERESALARVYRRIACLIEAVSHPRSYTLTCSSRVRRSFLSFRILLRSPRPEGSLYVAGESFPATLLQPTMPILTRRSGHAVASKSKKTESDASNRMSRPSRRSAGGADPMTPIASVSHGPPSSSSRSPQSMRLTVKLPAGKLREATRTGTGTIAVNSREHFLGGEILEGKRARNVKKSYVLPESDEEDDEEEEEEEDDEEDEEMEDVGDEDAEGEEDDQEMDDVSDDDADGDVVMDIPPPPPTIKVSKAQTGKQTIIVRPAGKSDGKTVEQKEQAEVSDDDEELSEIDSPVEDDEDDQQEGGDEDAEGDEEDEEIGVEEEEEDENPFGSDDEDTPAAGSRGSSPDINKMTKRQRARLEEGTNEFLMALPDGTIIRCHQTSC